MSENKLSAEELHRYSRHILLPELSLEGQLKLKGARVLVIGAGGLGCPILLYLAAAGVGYLGIVDFDVVEGSNLQRQILFTTRDIGKPKANIAAIRLNQLNPEITIRPFHTKLTSSNALEIMADFDLICDGTDNFPARYLINDACVLLGKTMVYGAIFRFEGQASVFNHQDADGKRGPHYRDLFPEPPAPATVPNCAEAGVLGVLPGIIGNIQANEIIKIITGIGEPLSGKLFILDTLTMESRTVKYAKNPGLPPVASLIDYDEFCDMKQTSPQAGYTISVGELKALLSVKNQIQIIDVREPQEFLLSNLGGKNIPLGELKTRIAEIPSSERIVLICRSGKRSAMALTTLLDSGYKNVLNLHGGLLAWKQAIDDKLLL
ncbi:MAG: molybdopterin-synthase adenylyltransferase MoeB [Cyclobacteriaceae bacterium]|nr:molybdopterin-synthase adenylyltransferase MoeB [Cyclobacteriaceae bacterium]